MVSFGIIVHDAFADAVTNTIPVGTYPTTTAVNSNTNMIYVANTQSGTISVINGTTNAVVSTINLLTTPYGIDVNPTSNVVYVAENTAWQPNPKAVIQVINGSTNQVVATITPQLYPYDLRVNPTTNKIYVLENSGFQTNGPTGAIQVINGTTDDITTTINTGSLPNHGIALDPTTNKIYVYNMVIDGTTDTIASQISGLCSYGLAVNQPTNRLYSTCSGSVQVVDLSTNTVIATVSAGAFGVDVNPTTNKIYVTDPGNSNNYTSVAIIDGSTNTVMQKITVGNGPSGVAINSHTNKAYVTNQGSNTVSVIDGNSASTFTAPSAPQSLQASAGNSQVTISWTIPSNNGGSTITGYKIERSTDSGTTWSTVQSNTGSTTTTYNDIGLAPSTTYTYRVSAINSVGTSSPSNTASATTQTATTPTGITLNNVKTTSGTVSSSPYQITLSNFNAGTGTNSLLVVGISANNNNVVSVTFGGVSLTKKVSTFSNNDAEFWNLKNPSGTGNIVVTMAGSTSAVVGAYSFSGVDQTTPIPTSVTNHNTTPSSPTISITTTNQNSLVLDLPSIYGGVTLGSPTCTPQWNTNMPSAITGASSSQVVSSPGTVTCSWTASSADFWDDAAIEVKASATGSGGTTTVPSSPTGLTATAGNSQITLSWTVPSSNGGSAITGYNVYRGTTSGSEGTTPVGTASGSTLSYTDTGLTNGQTYFYKVTAVNSVGQSMPSNEASATPAAPSTVPSAPTGLTANTISSSQINLSWTAPSNGGSAITGYKIERSTDGGTTWSTTVANTGSASTTYSDTGLAASTAYTYRVSAINSTGTSLSSNTASATTSSATPPSTTQVTITVNSVNLSGSPISGMSTVIRYTNGTTISEGFTPVSFKVTSGTTYVVHVRNYGTDIFNHWQDGTTNSYFTIKPTQNVTLTAYYTTG